MIDKKKILVEVSNRHIHVSRKNLDVLFGKNYKLKVFKKLSQPGEFASDAKVTLANGKNKIENVRILGPERNETQVELSRTDAINLKINAPLRESGDLKNTPRIKLIGPKGEVVLEKGVIVARRHMHVSDREAKELGLKDKDIVSIKIPGKREAIFSNVLVRVNPKYKMAVHLDSDEGNAADARGVVYGEIVVT